MREELESARLYGIVDAGYVQAEDMLMKCQNLIDGGAGIIQLRAKSWSEEQIEPVAGQLLEVCRKAKVPFVVNDFPGIAARLGADAVHVGQDDGSLASVRAIVGDEMIVGRSTHSPEQAKAALSEGFDYIGFGPLFPTPTKKGRPGIGMEAVAEVQKTVGEKIPMFCIGGITRQNVRAVINAGADRVVVVSDVLTDQSTTQACKEILFHF